MKASNLVQRIFTVVAGIFALVCIIFLLPQHNFIGFSIFVFAVSLAGSFEMSAILFCKTTVLAILSPVMIAFEYFTGSCQAYFYVLVITALTIEIFQGQKSGFDRSIENLSKNILLIVYPSYLTSYMIKFLCFERTNAYIILFYLLLVFSNDIFAYVAGMLWGKSNAGIFKASPKKSIAGFIGGFAGCTGICFLYTYFFKFCLPSMSVLQKTVLALLMSILSNLGDLAESVIKRCAGVKDSGKIIPGRGGILDCIDSIVSTIPFFCFVFRKVLS